MDEKEAVEEFIKSYNRMCRIRSAPHMCIPEIEDAAFLLDRIESFDEIHSPPPLRSFSVHFKMTWATEPRYVRHADFESTAEEETEHTSLPVAPKQLPKGTQ